MADGQRTGDAWAARWSARRIAALAYLVPVGTVGSVWYLLLFVASGPGSDRAALLRDWLTDDPQRSLFRWLAALPVACLALCVAHLSPAGRGRAAAAILCGAGIALALAAWRTLDASIAAVVTLPLLFSVPAAVEPWTRRAGAAA